MSTFHTHRCDTTDEMLLSEEIHDQDRCHGRKRGSHQKVPLNTPDSLEHLKAHLDGELLIGVQVDQRLEELIPRPEECIGHDDGQGRNAQRQQNPVEDSEGAHPVDFRRIIQVSRHRLHILDQEEYEEWGAAEGREDQGPVGVDHTCLDVHGVQGDQLGLQGNHHRADHQHEENSFSGKLQTGEAVGDQGNGKQLSDGLEDYQVEGVADEAKHGNAGEYVAEVHPLGDFREQHRRPKENIPPAFNGSREHPENRKQENDGEQDHEGVGDHRCGDLPPPMSSLHCFEGCFGFHRALSSPS